MLLIEPPPDSLSPTPTFSANRARHHVCFFQIYQVNSVCSAMSLLTAHDGWQPGKQLIMVSRPIQNDPGLHSRNTHVSIRSKRELNQWMYGCTNSPKKKCVLIHERQLHTHRERWSTMIASPCSWALCLYLQYFKIETNGDGASDIKNYLGQRMHGLRHVHYQAYSILHFQYNSFFHYCVYLSTLD